MGKVPSVDKIVSAKDYGGSASGYIRKMQQAIFSNRGVSVTIRELGQVPLGVPVYARIWQGQWIADCECNGASFVDPDEPIFFCFSCVNRANEFKPRPVVFPADWKQIEETLLLRPVDDMVGITDLERVAMARAVVYIDQNDGQGPKPLCRSWVPGETLEDLLAQQTEAIEAWKASVEVKE